MDPHIQDDLLVEALDQRRDTRSIASLPNNGCGLPGKGQRATNWWEQVRGTWQSTPMYSVCPRTYTHEDLRT